MRWHDQGFLLGARRHGETSAILEVFTARRGRHAGVLRGGASHKMAAVLQPGAQLDIEWSARLEEHMGTLKVEPVKSRAAQVLQNRAALAAMATVCGLLRQSLAERQPYDRLYHMTVELLDALGSAPEWPAMYLLWEYRLLEEMGFGLDLSRCAATGSRENLSYISPKTGRAVSREGAGEWISRLLPLPGVFLSGQVDLDTDVVEGLFVTGHFLGRRLAPALGIKRLPESRDRMIASLSRAASA